VLRSLEATPQKDLAGLGGSDALAFDGTG